MLTIVTGGPESRRGSHLLEGLKARAEEGRPGLLLVPESASHQAERRLLAHCGNPAGQFVSVTTFSKLTDDVLQAVGCRAETLDEGGRVLTMHRALSQISSALEYYRGAGRPQLTEKLVEAAAELQACAVSPEALLAVEELSPKLRDIGLIYAQYRALCLGGKRDPAERIDLARERLAESGLLAGRALFIEGFEGFTAQKAALLEAALPLCEDVTVALLLGEDELLYTEQRQTLHRLLRMAERCGLPARRIALPDEPEDRAPALRGLSRELFRFGPAEGRTGEGASLFLCDDPARECELTAALCRQRALEGVRLREMAVLCGDLEEYGPALSAAFEKYEIPLFLSEKTDVLQAPPMAAALGGLAALEDGLSQESVFDWLRRGLSGLTQDELDRLENYCYLWQIRGGKWLEPFSAPTCGYGLPAEDEADRLALVEGLRRRVAGEILALREALAPCREGGAFARALLKELERTGLESALEERCKALRLSGRERESAETAQLWHILQDALGQFSDVMDDVPMDRGEFVRLLRLMLRQYHVAAIPPSLDSVLAVEYERFSGEGLRELFFVGGREGLFPPEKPSLSLLTEPERDRLEEAGIRLTQNALERAWQQQCAVCRAVAAPREGLTVTAPRRLSDGTPCLEGYLFRRLGLLTGAALQEGSALLARLRLTAKKPLYQAACRAAQGAGAPEERAALAHEMADPRTGARIEGLRRYAASPRGPIADRALVRRLYGERLSMTASRIETVASCRFSYFMQYGLRARPRKRARFGPPEIGTFVHEVVEQAIRELCGNPQAEPDAVTVKHVNRYLEERLPRGQRTARFRAIFDQAGRLTCRIVRNVWEEIGAGDFRPVCFELSFGRGGDLPPLTLEEEGVTLTVSGRIDRVDGYIRGDTLYLKVVDYKTGRKSFHLSDVLYGLNLQMFLYLMLLEQGDRETLTRLTGAPQVARVEPCAALYIPARSPFLTCEPGESEDSLRARMDQELRRIGIVRGEGDLLQAMERGASFRFLPVAYKKDGGFTAASSVASAQQLGRLIRKTEQTLRRIAGRVAGGDVEADPYRVGREETACRFCDYRDACHFDPTMKKDKLRFLPQQPPARVHELLAEEEARQAERRPEA